MTEECRGRTIAGLRNAFPDTEQDGIMPNPLISTRRHAEGVSINFFLNIDLTTTPDTLIKEAVMPFVDGFQKLNRPTAHVFVCHASEDKPTARLLAEGLKKIGSDVWLDEWEINVGDSIVQKINDALGKVSHIVVLLSSHSVDKPWVKREMSAALMRQLSMNEIRMLPVLVDNCAIPPIISDLKYASLNVGLETVVADLEKAIFSSISEPHVDIA
ncbi:MAG: toll/interleukin-1 receptor domain-containing protein [Maritimibacter sp.]